MTHTNRDLLDIRCLGRSLPVEGMDVIGFDLPILVLLYVHYLVSGGISSGRCRFNIGPSPSSKCLMRGMNLLCNSMVAKLTSWYRAIFVERPNCGVLTCTQDGFDSELQRPRYGTIPTVGHKAAAT